MVGAGGIRLHTRTWAARGEARGRVLLVHGLGEHSGRYQHVADHLTGRGIGVVAFDLRGHGLSEGRRGRLRSFDFFLEDIRLAWEYAERRLPGDAPPSLYGHSLGGLIVLRYVQTLAPPAPGVVLSAPWLATARRLRPWTRAVVSFLSRILPDLPLARPHANPGVLSADPEMQDAYLRDPLVHHRLTPRFFQEVVGAQSDALDGDLPPALPVLVLAPLEDGMVDAGVTLRWAASLNHPAVTVRQLPSTHHEPHNDVDRDTVLNLIGSWIVERAGS
jgi:alpha-beta hydrolase superfamily lysophospholipase